MVEENAVWMAVMGGRENDEEEWVDGATTVLIPRAETRLIQWNGNACIRNWWDKYIGRGVSVAHYMPEPVWRSSQQASPEEAG